MFEFVCGVGGGGGVIFLFIVKIKKTVQTE